MPDSSGLEIESFNDELIARHIHSDVPGLREPTDEWVHDDRLWGNALKNYRFFSAREGAETSMNRINLLRYFELQEPYIKGRIERGIAENRKGSAKLTVVNPEGEPLPNVDIQIRQLTHDFKFGCNIFMLDGFDDEAKNQRYEEVFKDLFNLAVVPFYWAALEPEHGRLRFGKDSEKIFRRPAPDRVLEFCEANQIEPKGHPLLWHDLYPDWLPRDKEQIKPYIVERFMKIAERYANPIRTWDVVNEALVSHRFPKVVFPDDYVSWSFEKANRYFPCNNLFINELTEPAWDLAGKLSAYYLLIQNLILRGIRPDGIGMQFHMFRDRELLNETASHFLNPENLFKVLDSFRDFNLPIHISEITVPAYTYEPEDEQVQAQLLRNLYRLWFSHPSVEAIVWWNLNDGQAFMSEEQWKGGLLREDLTSKPAHDVLTNLIHQEWRTNLDLHHVNGNEIGFEGFYGEYQLTINHEGRETAKKIHLRKSGLKEFRVII